MARNVNDIIKSLPASRRRKIEKRAAALIGEEMTLGGWPGQAASDAGSPTTWGAPS
jgi:hypothetical protein